MEKFILKLREKPENERKRILLISLVVCMVIIGGIWLYSLTHIFTKKAEQKVISEEKNDKKPFQLLGLKFKDTYQNMKASAGNARNISSDFDSNIDVGVDNGKVIDLIPVNK